jgi:hypothetical protein
MKSDKRKPRKPTKRSTLGAYVNHVELLPSTWELTAVFSSASRSYSEDGGERWSTKEVARVTLPMGLAKVALFGLVAHVVGYEAQFGRIDVPAGLVPNLPSPESILPDALARLSIARAELFGQQPHAETQIEGTTGQASRAKTGVKTQKLH